MKEPVKPNEEDCCGSGCTPCIFDVYENQVQLYNKYLIIGETRIPLENSISQIEYTKFCVIKNMKLCDDQHFISFKSIEPSKTECGTKLWWKPGDHFLVKCCHSDKSCTKAFTPLKLNTISSNEGIDFSVIVKRYIDGFVSVYLCDLQEGDVTLWRGPYGNFELDKNKYQRIIMIAQGTGIAPYFSIIEKMLSDEDDMTRIILYYCCENLDNVLVRDLLYNYKSYWNFKYKIFVSYNNHINLKFQEPIEDHRFSSADVLELKPFTTNDYFLICGNLKFSSEYDAVLKKEDIIAENIFTF